MKKYISIYIILFLFTACENRENISAEANEVFYPSEDRFNSQRELAEVDLKSVENYAQLYEIMEKNACEGKSTVLKFNHKNLNYNIVGYVSCPETEGTDCFSRVNEMFISGDSLIYDYDVKLPVEELDEALNVLVVDPRKYAFQSTSLMPALIWFHGDKNQSIEVTKELLIRITTEFDKINQAEKGKFPYYINFKPYPYQRISLPPPSSSI